MRQLWPFCALSASFMMALGGFCMQCVAKLSSIPLAANVSGVFIVWSALGVFGVIGVAVQACTVGPLAGIVDRRNVSISVLAGILNCCGMLCLVTAIASDPDSAGPITAMLPLSSVEATILAWVISGEVLVPRQIVGISICVCGPMVMALADSSRHALTGLAHGGLAALCMGFFMYARKVIALRGAQPASVLLLICLVAGGIGLLGTMACFLIGRGLAGLSEVTTLIAVCSALAWLFGQALMQKALEGGPVGPADAIMNTNSVGVTLLTLAVWHIWPLPMKFVGMLCCIVGVVTLVLSKQKVAARKPAFAILPIQAGSMQKSADGGGDHLYLALV